jgi:hypothetical protein
MSSEDASPAVHMKEEQETPQRSSPVMSALKIVAASAFLWSAFSTFATSHASPALAESHRRLTQVSLGDTIPSYMEPLMKDLKERKKLMEETPPEEVKYWFEYTGSLQVCPIRDCMF